MNPAVPIVVTLLISLLPIALYCLVLSVINHRPAPVMIHGGWDFAGLCFAVSGIVLWTGPTLLVEFYRRSILTDSSRSFEEILRQWRLVWAVYYVVVIGGGLFLYWLRRSTTAIYNVQPEQVPPLVAAALRRLGIEFVQTGPRRFLIAARPTSASDRLAAPAPLEAELEIAPFAAMNHATLTWHATDPGVRAAVEAELRKELTGAAAGSESVAVWQAGVSFVLLAA
ncbi:MAG: hypothetical protein NZO58_04160, partial [Gemmataceae bacterium]|nr:hypothetical protein [Gemmataceae bacterium]